MNAVKTDFKVDDILKKIPGGKFGSELDRSQVLTELMRVAAKRPAVADKFNELRKKLETLGK